MPKDRDWIVTRFVDLNQQIKDETGIDLLQKSPQALATLCHADVLTGVCESLDRIENAIGYSGSSCCGRD